MAAGQDHVEQVGHGRPTSEQPVAPEPAHPRFNIDLLHATMPDLIPDCDPVRVSSIGNSAGIGARIALASRAQRREVEHLVGRIEKVETAMEPAF